MQLRSAKDTTVGSKRSGHGGGSPGYATIAGTGNDRMFTWDWLKEENDMSDDLTPTEDEKRALIEAAKKAAEQKRKTDSGVRERQKRQQEDSDKPKPPAGDGLFDWDRDQLP